MNKLLVKFDPKKQIPSIELFDPALSVETPTSIQKDVDPTKVHGILAPLIQVGDVVIEPQNIMEFKLYCVDTLPMFSAILYDQKRRLISLQKPEYGTTVKVQLVPPIPEVAKINLEFNISNIKMNDNYIRVIGNYKCEDLISQRVESLGELTTYQLFEALANATQLGFASNIAEGDDKRNMYCGSISYLDLMRQEINRAKNEANQCIYDWWIDLHNYINFANMHTLFNFQETYDDMQIYISTQQYNVRSDIETEGIKTPALLTNLPSQQTWDTYVSSYETINDGDVVRRVGTDNVYSTYESSAEGYSDNLVLNADAHSNNVTKIEYLGESYGEYNSKITGKVRENFLSKMGSDSIKVYLNRPALGIQRGQHVEFAWYVNDPVQDEYEQAFDEAGVLTDDDCCNESEDPDYEPLYPPSYGKLRLDKAVSGQYLIKSQIIKFMYGKWINELTLCRPLEGNQQRLNIKK